MHELRLYFSILVFCSLCFFVTLTSLYTDTSSNDSDDQAVEDEKGINRESYFNKLDYYILRDRKPLLKLNADELIQTYNNGEKILKFFEPKGIALSNNDMPVEYKAKKGRFNFDKNILSLQNEVLVHTENSKMKADKITYLINKEEVLGQGNIDSESFIAKTGDHILVKSEEVTFFPQKEISIFKKNVDGKVKRKKKYEEQIDFQSQLLKLNMPLNKIDLEEDVYVAKKQLHTWAKRGEIFLENYNKRLKYFSLYDDVRVEEFLVIDGRKVKRKAFGERLEGFTSLDRLVLTGFPKVFQEGDIIKGNKITLRINNEVVEVDDANTRFKLK